MESFYKKVRSVTEISVIIAVVIILIQLAREEKRRSAPKSTYEEQFITVPSLHKNIESFIGEKAPENTSYSYIPVYSHVYSSKDKPVPLTVMLSLRNTDMKNSLKIHKIFYYNTAGELIREYTPEGITLNPMETKEILIKQSDVDGGSGANFAVLFTMDSNSVPPIFETFMSGGTSDRGYSFSSRGTIYITPTEQLK